MKKIIFFMGIIFILSACSSNEKIKKVIIEESEPTYLLVPEKTK